MSHIAVVELHAEVGDDAVLVVLLVNIHRQRVVVGQRGNQFEKVHGVGTYHDFVGDAAIHFKLIGVEDDTYQHGVGLIKINNTHTLFGECDGGIGQDIL